LAALGLWIPVRAEAIAVWLESGSVRVWAPPLGIIAGKPLDHLRNGSPVPFAFQLSLTTDPYGATLARAIERFVVSYDLWEEKFSVVRLGHPRRSVSHLSAYEAEAWCVEGLALPASGAPARRALWVRLDARVEDPGDNPAVDSEGVVSLNRLIELFSRRARGEHGRRSLQMGPLRLAELQKARPEHVRKREQREPAAK
jgi:hypothetical protein